MILSVPKVALPASILLTVFLMTRVGSAQIVGGQFEQLYQFDGVHHAGSAFVGITYHMRLFPSTV
ncbi:MAG: hypothetical protein DWQ01_00645 [Planctomycetota bacterium]|nr:MAG: hypothetical protein DWQ01_00645 [Planctomycetota bacterium]